MKPGHPRWEEFKGGLLYQLRVPSEERCQHDHRYSRGVLRTMGFSRIARERAIRGFEKRGAYCDCEVLLNIAYREPV